MTPKKLKVAVLMGGPSREHEVSLKSGAQVLKHLDVDKYDAKKVLINKKGEWSIAPEDLKNKIDLAFIALHGTYGEDGVIQDILETRKIPYTGSGILTSALGMNKFLSLRLFRDAGLSVPISFLVTKLEWQESPKNVLNKIRHYTGHPIVIKPNSDGSSFGVSIAEDEYETEEALNEIFQTSKEALIQNYVEGREMTCSVLDHGWSGSAFSLMPTEIIPQANYFFDYKSKYEKGGAQEITPPVNLPNFLANILKKTAVHAHRLVGARGFSRTDMILDKSGKVCVLEINTIPGLTEESLLPKAALASGLPFSKLLDKIIDSAFGR